MDSLEKKIEELFSLYKQGLISKEEYENLKKEIIDEISSEKKSTNLEKNENAPESQDRGYKKTIDKEKIKKSDKKKKLFIIISVLLIIIVSIIIRITSNSEKNIEKNKTVEDKKETKTEFKELVIEGQNIWIRDAPTNGKVIMKLNTGDRCEVLKKGKFEEIRGMYDYWYKIKYNGQIGWVYGSQSNIKTGYTKNQALKLGLIEPEKNLNPTESSLKDFFESYSNNSDLNNYKNSTLGFSVLESRGARCFRRKVNSLVRKNFSINASSIFSNIPTGGQCDGYPNSKNGYYYETVDKKDLPIYATYVEGEERTERFPIPNQFSNNKLLKVCIIRNEEWQADFYFIEIESKLYFFCQDLCGCSA